MRLSKREMIELNNVCSYVSERIGIDGLTLDNYVSTENMISNKEGICKSSGLPKTNAVRYRMGDVLVSNIRPYFKKIWSADREGGCSADVLNFRVNENYNSKFLYYVLSDDEFFRYSVGTSRGTKMPRGDKAALLKYSVPKISIDEQERIVEILSAFDDRIKLNKKINKNLEQQISLIFHQLFDEESAFVELGSVIETTSGGTPSRKIPEFYENASVCWVKSKELNSFYIIDTEEKINELAISNSSAKLLPAYSVLIAMYGATVGEYAIIAKNMTCNQAVCALIQNEKYPYTYLFQVAKASKAILVNMAVGSAQQNISQILIKQLQVHSDIGKIQQYHSVVEPMYHQMELIQRENNLLVNTRDTILPKLMSGEIDVLEVSI